MAARKRRRRGPGLLWRVLFGNNGPTRGELRKLLKLSFTNTFDLNVRDPASGKMRRQRMRIDPDGRVYEVKAPAKKKPAAKKKASARRTASQLSKASKPSAASKSERPRQPRQSAPGIQPTPRRPRVEPLSERVLRNPDGTLAGSRKATYAGAQREYAKVMKNAEAASKRAEYLLGWQPVPRARKPKA